VKIGCRLEGFEMKAKLCPIEHAAQVKMSPGKAMTLLKVIRP
jgi:hypothetical protein